MVDNWFAVKIATFNALGFALCLAGTTFVDARLTTHVVYGARNYPNGYLMAALGGGCVLITSYLSFCGNFSWQLKAVLPSAIVVLMGVISLLFFKPELPHAGLVLWLTLIAVVSLLTCFIRLSPLETFWLTDTGIAETARIERIKEYANLWRMIAVSATFGTIALIVPWSDFNWKMPGNTVKAPTEAFLLGQYGAVGMTIICIYAMFGFVYESFHKAKIAADLLLLIKQ